MSQEDKKIKERRKNKIHSMFQEKLQQLLLKDFSWAWCKTDGRMWYVRSGFNKIEINNIELNNFKKIIDAMDIDIEKLTVSDSFFFDKIKEADTKYFISYKIRPLFIEPLKMNRYHNEFEKTYCMSFTIKDKELLEKINLE